ncbi:hypothetical protein D3C76_1224870 [compost metagenome]
MQPIMGLDQPLPLAAVTLGAKPQIAGALWHLAQPRVAPGTLPALNRLGLGMRQRVDPP